MKKLIMVLLVASCALGLSSCEASGDDDYVETSAYVDFVEVERGMNIYNRGYRIICDQYTGNLYYVTASSMFPILDADGTPKKYEPENHK